MRIFTFAIFTAFAAAKMEENRDLRKCASFWDPGGLTPLF